MKKIYCILSALLISSICVAQDEEQLAEEKSSDWVTVSIPSRTNTTTSPNTTSRSGKSKKPAATTTKRTTTPSTTASKPSAPQPNPARTGTTPKSDEFSKTNQEIKRFKKNN